MRTQRQARGWSVAEMRRRLRDAATEAGDNLPANDCLSVMIHRWEDDRSGISERYRLHFCKAFQIPIDEFGSLRARPALAIVGPAQQQPAPVSVSNGASPAGTATRPENRPNPAIAGRSWIE